VRSWFSRRGRIWVTRLLAAFIIALVFLTESVWEEKSPMLDESLYTLGLVLASIGAVGRLWCSLYIAGRKTTGLIAEGPYSLCRHPLYFFSLLGVVGVGFGCERFSIAIILVLAFAAYYPWVIRHEERKMRARHGAAYDAYARSVPCFIPRLHGWHEPDEYVTSPAVFRRHIASALWFIWLVGLAELIEELHQHGTLPVLWMLY